MILGITLISLLSQTNPSEYKKIIDSTVYLQFCFDNGNKPYCELGSGVIVANDENFSFILTAAHVSKDIGKNKNAKSFVSNNKGDKCDVSLIVEDKKSDVSLLLADCILGPELDGGELPDIGSVVISSSFSSGIKFDGAMFVSPGIFSGVINNGKVLFSMPATTGCSGGPIIFNGKIISLVSMVNIEFKYLVLGTDHDATIKIINIAKELASNE